MLLIVPFRWAIVGLRAVVAWQHSATNTIQLEGASC
jgi:hypothetical protein